MTPVQQPPTWFQIKERLDWRPTLLESERLPLQSSIDQHRVLGRNQSPSPFQRCRYSAPKGYRFWRGLPQTTWPESPAPAPLLGLLSDLNHP